MELQFYFYFMHMSVILRSVSKKNFSGNAKLFFVFLHLNDTEKQMNF